MKCEFKTCFHSAPTQRRFCHSSLYANLMGVDVMVDLSVYGETVPPFYLEATADKSRRDPRGENNGRDLFSPVSPN